MNTSSPKQPTSPPPRIKPSKDDSQQAQKQDGKDEKTKKEEEYELGSSFIPTLTQLYSEQSILQATFDPTPLREIFFHAIRYPTQTVLGLMIGQFKEEKLHIVEIVPVSHTTTTSPTILQSALEITNLKIAKTSSLTNFKNEMAFVAAAGAMGTGGGPGGISNGLSQSGQGTHSEGQQFDPLNTSNSTTSPHSGMTMNGFMDSIEDFIKKENEKEKQGNLFQQNNASQAEVVESLGDDLQSNSHQDQFICGVYISPSPSPKIHTSVLKTLATTDHDSYEYQYAVQQYIHAVLKAIAPSHLEFFYQLTMQCPNPLLTILDPILLNINTEAYSQYGTLQAHHNQLQQLKSRGQKPSAQLPELTIDQINLISKPFNPPLPSLLTYFLHDDVLLGVTNDDFSSDKRIVDVLFLDKVFQFDNDGDKITIDMMEKPHYPTTTHVNSTDWARIMTDVKKQAYFTLIDWQETLSD